MPFFAFIVSFCRTILSRFFPLFANLLASAISFLVRIFSSFFSGIFGGIWRVILFLWRWFWGLSFFQHFILFLFFPLGKWVLGGIVVLMLGLLAYVFTDIFNQIIHFFSIKFLEIASYVVAFILRLLDFSNVLAFITEQVGNLPPCIPTIMSSCGLGVALGLVASTASLIFGVKIFFVMLKIIRG